MPFGTSPVLEVILQALVAVVLVVTTYLLARGRWATRKAYVVVLCLLPVSQMVTVAFMLHLVIPSVHASYGVPIVCVVALVCAAGDVLLVRGTDTALTMRSAEEKARVLEEQVELQRSYYQSLVLERQKAAALRKEFARSLAAVRSSIEQHEREQALDATAAAADVLKPSVQRYCAHRVVDALLMGREAEFERAGITFTCNVAIPDECDLSDVVLCAAFSNLLSNAAKAAVELPHGQRWIDLRARVVNGNLAVRVQNSCLPHGAPAPKPSETAALRLRSLSEVHGWGLDILRLLACDHDGSLETRHEGSRFTAELVLSV